MKHYLLALTALAFMATGVEAKPKAKAEPEKGFKFTDTVTVPTTSVKDQNKSGTCWSFSGLGFIENEILRRTGKEYDLSEMWIVRHCYTDKADKYVRMDGKTNFAAGGSTLDVAYVIDNYGIVPEEAYTGLQYGEEKHDHYELDPVLTAMVEQVNEKKGKKTTAWKKAVEGTLDAYLGEKPESFTVEGTTYTPRTFADALGIKGSDFVAVTSFTHHTFYTTFSYTHMTLPTNR